jgi:arylsulfatase A-like enzyme
MNAYIRKSLSHCLLISLTSLQVFSQSHTKPNILFIAVDDLKTELGCYGNNRIQTPNIDRLASTGTLFKQNYVQQAVCGPTRASIMTGMRPDYTKVWDLKTRMRDMNPDILSLPQYLITQGYSTQGIGKIYDVRCVDKKLDEPSWSVPYYKVDKKYYSQETGLPVLNYYQNPETKLQAKKYLDELSEKGMAGEDAITEVLKKLKPATECMDVPDNAYTDGANVLEACDILKQLSTEKKPFFFAVGFSKPHLPFVSPKKYWDKYKRDEMPLAEFQKPAANAVDIAYHNAGELRAYTDIMPVIPKAQDSIGVTLSIDQQKELIHGYYAAVSYTDAQVGKLLKVLDSLDLRKNTIVVLWGDHGWHLGDHNLWCKHTDFEQATHAPLIISAPGMKPNVVNTPTEFVDVFPTLCALAGIDIPSHLDGKKMDQLMMNPETKFKEYAVSQYPRSGPMAETERLGYANAIYMGYSFRSKRYRFTMWMKDTYRSYDEFNESKIYGTELYDYEKDPNETINVVNQKEYNTIARKMKHDMIAFFDLQRKKYSNKK